MTETLVTGGLLCIAAAIVGGGIKLLNAGEIPVINSVPRQAALGLFGASLVAAGVYMTSTSSFRVDSARMTADQRVILTCPARVLYTAIITVAGAGGTVEFRFVHNGRPFAPLVLEFRTPGSRSASQSVDIQPSLPGLPRLGPDDMAVEILAPNALVTAPVEVPVLC